MNTQTRLNQLMSFQENLKQKISNLPEGELCIYQSPSYQKWICSLPGKQKYLSKKNQPLAEALALKKYYSLLLAEAEEELSLLNFYIKSHEKKNSAVNRSKPLTSSDLLAESSPITHYCKAILQRTSFRCLHRNGARRAMKPILLIRKI
ncbi:MAG: hypothetical protein ACLR7F_05180 [Waltera sp.]